MRVWVGAREGRLGGSHEMVGIVPGSGTEKDQVTVGLDVPAAAEGLIELFDEHEQVSPSVGGSAIGPERARGRQTRDRVFRLAGEPGEQHFLVRDDRRLGEKTFLVVVPDATRTEGLDAQAGRRRWQAGKPSLIGEEGEFGLAPSLRESGGRERGFVVAS